MGGECYGANGVGLSDFAVRQSSQTNTRNCEEMICEKAPSKKIMFTLRQLGLLCICREWKWRRGLSVFLFYKNGSSLINCDLAW